MNTFKQYIKKRWVHEVRHHAQNHVLKYIELSEYFILFTCTLFGVRFNFYVSEHLDNFKMPLTNYDMFKLFKNDNIVQNTIN